MDQLQYGLRLQSEKERYYRIAYSYVKNEHDALDIVGEAAYKGLRQLRTLRHQDTFTTWMTRIVVNCAIDHIRKNSRIVYMEDGAPEPVDVPDSALEPEDSLDLYDALEVLPERDRTCITLRYFEGYTFIEIARILGEGEATVKSRVYRALKKMRAYMQEGGI